MPFASARVRFRGRSWGRAVQASNSSSFELLALLKSARAAPRRSPARAARWGSARPPSVPPSAPQRPPNDTLG
eukprot:5297855-Alexandrium_andersonii.AAC.1